MKIQLFLGPTCPVLNIEAEVTDDVKYVSCCGKLLERDGPYRDGSAGCSFTVTTLPAPKNAKILEV